MSATLYMHGNPTVKAMLDARGQDTTIKMHAQISTVVSTPMRTHPPAEEKGVRTAEMISKHAYQQAKRLDQHLLCTALINPRTKPSGVVQPETTSFTSF